jgi:hypothetical protein
MHVSPVLYTPFGDGEGRGYTVRLSFDVCQSHHQESAARLPQIFDHRSMFVSHTTRNLRHECRRFSIIDQCLSVTPPGICGTNAADFRSLINVCQSYHQESAAFVPQIFDHRSMSVSHTTRNLRHECRRFSIIDQCLSVYSLFGDGEGRGYTVTFDICQSHHQESAARMPQIFDH